MTRRQAAHKFLNKVLPPIEYGESKKGKISFTDKRYSRILTEGSQESSALDFYAFLVRKKVLKHFIYNVLNENRGYYRRTVIKPSIYLTHAFSWYSAEKRDESTWSALSDAWDIEIDGRYR